MVVALDAARQRFDAGSHDRRLFTIHAVRVLAESAKDRSNDELANVIRAELDGGGRADIPDHALDMHTRRGQQLVAASSTSSPKAPVSNRNWSHENDDGESSCSPRSACRRMIEDGNG